MHPADISAALQRVGYTQKQVGDECGVGRGVANAVIRGVGRSTTPPPVLTAASSGAMLGASLSALALATLIANVAACRVLLTQLVALQARRDGLQPVEEAKEE